MRFLSKLAIALVLLITTIPLAWSAPPPYQYTAEDFLYETWFKVEAADLLGTGASQLVVLGRDYIEGRLPCNCCPGKG